MIGCGYEISGEEDLLSFNDPTNYPDDGLFGQHRLDESIAVGGRVQVAVTGSEGPLTASLDSSEVLAIESAPGGDRLYVRALSEGSAVLSVTTPAGVTDTLRLTVRAADDVEIFVDEGLLAGAAEHPTAVSGGYALRPGAELTVAGSPRVEGERLTGFDFLGWTEADGLLNVGPEEDVNTVSFSGAGVEGVTTLKTDAGGAFEVATLAVDTPTQLVAYNISDVTEPVAITRLTDDEVPLFAVIAYDNEGRYVHPSRADEQSFSLTVTSGDVVVRAVDYGFGGVVLDACPGEGEVEVRFAGGVLSLPIAISEGSTGGSGC
jgi:hypothetical protein